MKAPVYRFVAILFLSIGATIQAETVKDREGAVRKDRANMLDNERWIYQDIEAGFAEAKKTGKPLMVVLRCVPCLSCMGIDTGVLMENTELTPLMDQFVRVRVINANALDLEKFQFDYDLSFTTMFFHGDGTVYGRYGSWEHQHDPQNTATATFRTALEGALALHKSYPANKTQLRGKQGKSPAHGKPIDIPQLKVKYKAELDWNGKVVQSCVHCHQIGDAQRLNIRESRKPMPVNLIFPHPAPETIGLELEATRGIRIKSVKPGSPAGQAGLRAGDRLASFGGQPLISTADVSWVLHHFSNGGGGLGAGIVRNGKSITYKVDIPQEWREKSDMSRRVGAWQMRMMAFGGMRLEELPDDERRKLGINDDQLALFAKNVGKYGKHALARKQGWKIGDILVEVDGDDTRITESQLLGRILQANKPGDRIPVAVLRGKKRMPLKIPVQ